ncbi:MAG: alanine dehydrogenase [Cyclobacteriaceae bacterium]|nr:alanine dehydrogenase [Cyclobacteriaceae bacterium]MCH8515565.1 alanine dehydrogenase [Cyclobacteriaceae bacterium]
MTSKYGSEIKTLAKEGMLYPQESLAPVKKDSKSLFIGLPKENASQENRLSLTPEGVGILVNNGHRVLVETGAGLASHFTDQDYSDHGAQIAYSSKEVYESDIVIKVEPPSISEIEMMKTGRTLLSALPLGKLSADYFEALNKKKILAIGFEYIQDKVGGMPVVRAMSEIAGSTVMLIAAEYLSSANGGKGIILGGITGLPPTNVVVLGSGTVAEYAGRAALGLGANIHIFDNQIYKLRRIKQLLGQQVYTSTIDSYNLNNSLNHADVVIGALRSEKGRSRVIVTEEMVSKMKPGSIIIDVSIDQGGCIETSEMTTHGNPVFKKYDIIHYCVPNIASRVARTATAVFSNIFTPIFLQISDAGGVEDMIFKYTWFTKGVYAYNGSLTNAHIANKFNMKHKDLSLIMAARF